LRVVLETNVLSKASYSELGTVFYHGITRQHRILVEDQNSAGFVDWQSSLPQDPHRDWLWALRDGRRLDGQDPGHYEIRVAHIEASEWSFPVPRLTVADAIQLLKAPFRILLEDDQTDRAFLLSMAEPEQRRYLEELEGKDYLRFEHGGGLGKMKATVQRDRKKRTAYFGRMWVLFDSDGLRPDLRSDDAKRLEKSCGRLISHHMLKRRSIENYLPLTSLKSWIDRIPPRERGGRPAKHNALREMSKEQRYHFNMKNGFSGDKKRDDARTVGNLYEGLPENVRRDLKEGFGGKVAHLFQSQVSERQLRNDGGWAEFHPTVDKLIKYIK
jgi:hypothetical protein